jgi:hypothetical protein
VVRSNLEVGRTSPAHGHPISISPVVLSHRSAQPDEVGQRSHGGSMVTPSDDGRDVPGFLYTMLCCPHLRSCNTHSLQPINETSAHRGSNRRLGVALKHTRPQPCQWVLPQNYPLLSVIGQNAGSFDLTWQCFLCFSHIPHPCSPLSPGLGGHSSPSLGQPARECPIYEMNPSTKHSHPFPAKAACFFELQHGMAAEPRPRSRPARGCQIPDAEEEEDPLPEIGAS